MLPIFLVQAQKANGSNSARSSTYVYARIYVHANAYVSTQACVHASAYLSTRAFFHVSAYVSNRACFYAIHLLCFESATFYMLSHVLAKF